MAFLRHPDTKPLKKVGSDDLIGRNIGIFMDSGDEFILNLYDERAGRGDVAAFTFQGTWGFDTYSLAERATSLGLTSSRGGKPIDIDALTADGMRQALARVHAVAEEERQKGRL